MGHSPPGFSVCGILRQEYWSGLHYILPGDLPDQGIKPAASALQADSLPLRHRGSLKSVFIITKKSQERDVVPFCASNRSLWVLDQERVRPGGGWHGSQMRAIRAGTRWSGTEKRGDEWLLTSPGHTDSMWQDWLKPYPLTLESILLTDLIKDVLIKKHFN